MKELHIPEVMRTGKFTNSRILRIIGDEDSGGKTYSIQYSCNNMSDFSNMNMTMRRLCVRSIRQNSKINLLPSGHYWKLLTERCCDYSFYY